MLAALAGRPGAAMSKNAAVKVFEKSVFDFFAEKSVVVSEQIVSVPIYPWYRISSNCAVVNP